ncbi:MAG: four helix bundle protein [Flavobacteriales bacterium]|nr:four helix bundle protein [Flavobacteriales bacterium]
MARTVEDLVVWQLSRELMNDVFDLCDELPTNSRNFGLQDQIKRAVVSIMTNISEVASRSSLKEYGRFLDYANGSSAEVRTQLIVF